jgi:hypothetical protein
MIRSISYSRYLKIATLMAAGRAKVAKNELRELAHGILPAVLAEGGLRSPDSGGTLLAAKLPVSAR